MFSPASLKLTFDPNSEGVLQSDDGTELYFDLWLLLYFESPSLLLYLDPFPWFPYIEPCPEIVYSDPWLVYSDPWSVLECLELLISDSVLNELDELKLVEPSLPVLVT